MKIHQLIGYMVLLLLVRGVQKESDCKNWTINDCKTKSGDPMQKLSCYIDESGDYELCENTCSKGLSKKCEGYCMSYFENCHRLTTTPSDASSLSADISAPPIGNTTTTQVVMSGTSQQNSHESTTAALNPRNVVTLTVFLVIFIILFLLSLCIGAFGFDKELFKSRISDVRERKWPRKNNFIQRDMERGIAPAFRLDKVSNSPVGNVPKGPNGTSVQVVNGDSTSMRNRPKSNGLAVQKADVQTQGTPCQDASLMNSTKENGCGKPNVASHDGKQIKHKPYPQKTNDQNGIEDGDKSQVAEKLPLLATVKEDTKVPESQHLKSSQEGANDEGVMQPSNTSQ